MKKYGKKNTYGHFKSIEEIGTRCFKGFPGLIKVYKSIISWKKKKPGSTVGNLINKVLNAQKEELRHEMHRIMETAIFYVLIALAQDAKSVTFMAC